MSAAYFAVFEYNRQNEFTLDKEGHGTIIPAFVLLRLFAIYKLKQPTYCLVFRGTHSFDYGIGIRVVEAHNKAVASVQFLT